PSVDRMSRGRTEPPDGSGSRTTEGGVMLVTRSTAVAVALVMIALATRMSGAQTPATKPTAAQPPAATQGDASAVYKKLSMFVYPAKGQSAEKQKKDEQECYTWAKDQTS